MTTYKTIAESNNFIVLDSYEKDWQVRAGLLRDLLLSSSKTELEA